MATLTPQQFEANIKPGVILYFPDPIALKNPDRHFFICLGTSVDGDLIFSCCTSRFHTVQRLIERNRYPESTLVVIDPVAPFTKETYVNCNEYFPYTLAELWQLSMQNQLSFEGELDLDPLYQILLGIRASNIIEQELKDALPDIDDL